MQLVLSIALAALLSGSGVAHTRLMGLSDVPQRQAASSDLLASQIDGYFHGSGFPRAGRSLEDKIREAEDFLAREIPKSGIVGTGVAIVYNDEVVLSRGYGLQRWNDSTRAVAGDSMFQIGSVTKTMIAVAVGLLVEEKKVNWKDPVKKHIPWLQLYDKYAEAHVTIGDLLAMNSGFGSEPDLADFLGKFASERSYVEALKDYEPTYSLRETPAYANVNFAILGQLIESVSGLPWHQFLRERIWKPLGMNHTFASANDVPASLRTEALNDGHFACDGEVLGPYDLVSAPETQISLGREGGYNAAGSVVSSANDMAIFLRLLLNKGRVGNVTLLQSPSTIAEMVTGKALASDAVTTIFGRTGLHYEPDGATLAAGYGFDIIGHVLWGRAYFDKSGDVATQQTRTGFAPTENLAVVLLGNTQVPESHASFYLDHYRSYVLGVFLDVPRAILDLEFAKWRAADQLEAPFPGTPRCGTRFWRDPPRIVLPEDEADALVGSYVAAKSAAFFPEVAISRGAAGAFVVAIASREYEVVCVGVVGAMKLFFSVGSAILFGASRDASRASFTLALGVPYRLRQP